MLQFLDDNQKRALNRMMAPETPNVFIAWWKMGTGKTRLALAAFDASGFDDCIIVCRRISFGDWMDEMEIVQLNVNCWEDSYDPKKLVKLAHNKTPSRRVLFLSAGDLKNIPVNFPKGAFLIVDELYLFSNAKSKRSKLLRQMSLCCSARLGLSGTIMPARNNLSIFGQLSSLNAHHPLASGSTEFITRYQVRSRGRFGQTTVNKPGSNEKIQALIADRVDCYFPESRPTRIQIVKVDKTLQQNQAVKKLKELYEWENKTYKYVLQIVHVINGISNGWFINENGILLSYKSTKIERLQTLLDDLVVADERVVVWCSYHNDISRIASELKHPYLEFSARVPFDSARWESGKVNIVLATEANGASVNHFKHVKYAIYFSINYKLLDLEQSMARHERKGSSHDGAHYYFLQTRGTNDSRAYELVKSSKSSEEQLVQTLARQFFVS